MKARNITEPGTREPSEAEQTRSGTRIRIWIECSARLSSEISSLSLWWIWPYGILIAYGKLSPSQSRGRGNRARPSRPDQERESGSGSNVLLGLALRSRRCLCGGSGLTESLSRTERCPHHRAVDAGT